MAPRLLVTLNLTPAQRDTIAAAVKGLTVDYIDKSALDENAVAGYDIIFGNVPPALIKRASSLKWLQLNSAGADPYLKGVLKEDVLLTTAVGAYGLSVSEHMLCMLMAMNRRLPEYVLNQKSAVWQPQGEVKSIEGSTVLCLGAGNIGGDFLRKVKALGAHTIGVRRNIAAKPDYVDEQYTLSGLDALLPRADVVALVLPLSEETRSVIGQKQLALMQPHSTLINVGRGALIDTDALTSALKNTPSMSACLDVADPEPLPSTHPLWQMSNVLITPHVAGQFFLPETVNRIVGIFTDNLIAYQSGMTLKNIMPHSL